MAKRVLKKAISAGGSPSLSFTKEVDKKAVVTNDTYFNVTSARGGKRFIIDVVDENDPDVLTLKNKKESHKKEKEPVKSKMRNEVRHLQVNKARAINIQLDELTPDKITNIAEQKIINQFQEATEKKIEKKTGFDSADFKIINQAFDEIRKVMEKEERDFIFPDVKASNFDLIIQVLSDEISCLSGELRDKVQLIIDSEGYGE